MGKMSIPFGFSPGGDDKNELADMLENMGRLDIRLLCYNFMVGMNWGRTRADVPIRGGALASGFDHARMQDHTPMDGVGVISAEQVWENYAYFIERVGPVAAEHPLVQDSSVHPQQRGC